MVDSVLEANGAADYFGSQNLSAITIIQQSIQQGIALVTIVASNLSLLQTLDLPADATARITANVQNGLTVIVPTQALSVGGQPMTAWFNLNSTTGEMIAESQNGGYQGLTELGVLGVAVSIHLIIFKAFAIGYDEQPEQYKNPQLTHDLRIVNAVLAFVPNVYDVIAKIQDLISAVGRSDPPEDGTIGSLQVGTQEGNQATESLLLVARVAGQATGTAQSSSLVASGDLAASWTSGMTSEFSASALVRSVATVMNSQGATIGSGEVALSAESPIVGRTDRKCSVHHRWDGECIVLRIRPRRVWGLPLAGPITRQPLRATSRSHSQPTASHSMDRRFPAGTYTITTSSASLSGSGQTTSANVSGSESITATDGTISLGPGSGNVSVGGNVLAATNGATLDGYTGSITIAAGGGNNTDSVTVDGNAANVLTVSATPTTLTTDQNTPVTFQANVNTSLADTYTLTAQTPDGWTVTIDSSGNVTVTPAPGLQGGTYPIQVIAQSSTDPNLVAQTTVEVTITPTQPGMTFAVNPDPLFTVPYDGAQVPTAFRAVIDNTGPAADTYNLSFANVPSGFTLVSSATSDTVPAGQTGIVGIYLIPNAGSVLPAPGTPLSFQVTATSTSNPAITQTVTESFTMPVDRRRDDRQQPRPGIDRAGPASDGHGDPRERRQRGGKRRRSHSAPTPA